MRIAQVAPLAEPVPPKLYGGTERVVSWLTEELLAPRTRGDAVRKWRLGHQREAHSRHPASDEFEKSSSSVSPAIEWQGPTSTITRLWLAA
jgi:hypothetical protein